MRIKKKAVMVTPSFYGYGGLLIAGIMESFGCNVKITRNIGDIPLLARKADLVCLSLQSTTDLFQIKNYLDKPKIQRGKLIVAGGPAVQDPVFASRILRAVDVFVLGEGEETIIDILDIESKDDAANLKGIALIKDSNIVRTQSRKAPSLIERPFPKIPKDLPNQLVRGVNIYIETHRGCRGKCVYCQCNTLFGNRVRSRPLEEILKEIRYFSGHGVERIAFSGGDVSLYSLRSEEEKGESFISLVRETSRIIGKENLAGPDIRPDNISESILEAVKGFTQGWIYLGIESGSRRMLRLFRKGIKLEDIFSGVQLAKKSEVSILGSFMVGAIGETDTDFSETNQLVSDLMLDKYSINIIEPLPDTPYWETTKKSSLQKNPLFMLSDRLIRGQRLSVAEERAMTLYETIFEARHGQKMDAKTTAEILFEVRQEAERIRSIIRAMRSS